jgi:glycosyltransferase involved in cell wall biosynthesis
VAPDEARSDESLLRVLFVNPTGGLGGAERSLLDILSVFRGGDVEASLLVLEPGPLVAEAKRVGIETRELPMPRSLTELGDFGLGAKGRLRGMGELALRTARMTPDLLRYCRELRIALDDGRPDIVHSNGIKSHLLCALTTPRRARLVWHIRDFIGDRPFIHGALRLVARRAALALANSNAVAEDARRALPGLTVRTVYNAIDTDNFSPGPVDGAMLDTLAELSPAPPTTLRIGLVATYARWKGHGVFLRAAAALVRRQPEVPLRFYIVGGPLYATPGSQFSRDELRDLARQLGVLDHVGFVPFQTNPRDVYRALDIVVQASTRPEPFGRTIVEAMACGRPVIVARAGGAVELFRDGVEAQAFDAGSEADLTSAMSSLVRDDDRRRKLSERSRMRACEQFGRQRLREELLRVWEDCTRQLH